MQPARDGLVKVAAPGADASRPPGSGAEAVLSRLGPRRGRELFGESALRRGWVTAEQLYVALTVQKHSELAGREVARLGAILVHIGAMSPDQVGDVLEDMVRE